MSDNRAHWGYLPAAIKTKAPEPEPKPAPHARQTLQDLVKTDTTCKGGKIPDARVLAIYRSKGDMTATEASTHYGVHVSTVSSIWRKAVRAALLRDEP